ncbi:MAG: ATP-binding cassette domain-containing protein [Planctomycetes bacterium]|nr:ATP-binding cassette domain-containing protein [Planctomycetota bacterium]
MSIFLLLRRGSPLKLATVLGLTLLSSVLLAETFLISGQVWGMHRWAPLAASILALALCGGVQYFAARSFYDLFEEAIERTRSQSLALLATSELAVAQGLGLREMASIVTGDARVVSAALPTITIFICFVSWTIVSIVILAFNSLVMVAFLVILAMVCVAVCERVGDTETILQESQVPEAALRSIFEDLTGGIRELVTDREKGRELAAEARKAAGEAAEIRRSAGPVFGSSLAMVEGLFAFAIVAVHEFRSGAFGSVTIPMEVLVLLAFVTGHLKRVFYLRCELKAVSQAARRMVVLETGLATAPRVPVSKADFREFKTIRFENVQVSHPPIGEGGGFVLGPANLSFRRGEIVLVRGPNGAGKSTFVDLLVGISKPGQGSLAVDGTPVVTANLEAYRSLFSVVSANPHLFDRLYGHTKFDDEFARDWLAYLELPSDVVIDAPRTSSGALSKGQQKRLAVVRALLEKRPILVLDEYTADQDPCSRDRFYSEFLPRLRKAGRTVIAVVHDEVPAEAADLVILIEGGRVAATVGPRS